VPCQTEVAALWSAAWSRLVSTYPDLEARLAELPRAGVVARLESSAGRQAGRAVRGGETELAEFRSRLAKWEAAVVNALAEQDHARSLRTCGWCGRSNVATVGLGLTGARPCAECLGERGAA